MNYAGTEKQSLQYEYLSTGNLLDDAASRVTQVKAGATTVAVYKYLGATQLVSQQLAEAGVTSARYGSGTANYDRLDRFNRIVKDRWAKDGGSDLYSADITFDESGNITRQVDNLHRNYGGASNPGVFDASYTIDSRSRLTRTQEGHWNGSSISTLWRDQQWTLSQTGNWARDKEDWNGDGDFVDSGEVDDTRAHNVANELLTRDTDSNSSVNYTLTHDAVGNMTDDGKDYKFVYDALGRLKTVKNQSNTVVAEYTYNGLNMRIGWHYDADADADVDANDPWYSFAHDDRWRIVATFRGSDTSPKELFAYHNAGANGRGGSSYIDSVILRNKDANTAWTSASDATLEERLYYVQNWRADVSAVLSDAGLVKEWIKYTSYGIPVRIDPGDYNRDGFVNAADFDDYSDDFDNARAEADVNFDGTVNGDDYDLFSEWWDAPSTAGRFTLSASSVGNRVGYAGYQYDPTFVGASRAIFHVRNRVYDAGLGRWTRRDPIGYKAGVNLYAYVNDEPINGQDPLGLDKAICTGGCDLGSSGPPKEPIKPAKPFVPPGKDCSQAVKDCKNGNSRVIEQLEKVESKCGDTPSINCEQCSGSEDAYHSSDRQNDPGSITICQNNIRDKMFICDAILHELQHAADKCDGFKSTLCEDFACLEVRAVNISGQCCPGRPYRMFPPPGAPNPFASYEDCVKWYAKDSVKNRKDKSGSPCNPGDSEVAKQINGCYSLIDSPCHERPNLGSGSTTYQ